jgi:hypothetical protein
MRTRFASSLVTVLGTLCLVAAGCQSPAPKDGDVSEIHLALMTVPTDVLCVDVTITSSTTIDKKFDVTPGSSALITVSNVPAGPATIDEKGYNVACAMVTPGVTPPTWVAAMPVSVTLAAGQTTDVSITLKRPPMIRIANDYQDSPILTAAPLSLAFPTPVTVGGSSPSLSVTVSNTGTVPAIFGASMSGSDAAHFGVTTSGCPASGTVMQIGAVCTVTVTFTPTTAGPKTAFLALGQPAATLVPVSGMAQVIALSATPSVNFGSVFLLNTPATQGVLVTNTGTVPVAVPTSLTGTDAALFSISATTCPASPATLAVGAMCTLTMAHAPSTLGVKSAALNLGSPTLATTPLSSTVVTPITATSVNFGNVTVGTTGPTNQTVIVNNMGTAAINVTPALAGGDAPMFAVVTSSCTTLAGGAGCQVTLRFSPSATGTRSTNLNLGSPMIVATAAVTGTGVPAVVNASPPTWSFPTTLVGTVAPTEVFNVTNAGLGNVPFATAISGAPDFTIVTTNCPGGGAMLNGGQTCMVTVQFLPASAGAKTGALTLGSPVVTSVNLSGTGATASVTLSQPALNFGAVQTGGPGATLALGVTNTGMVAAPVAPSISGTDAASFVIASNNCPTPLAVGASCGMQLRAVPSSAAAKSATLAIGSAAMVALSATGMSTPTLQLLQPALDFGTVVVTAPVVSQTVRIVNTSTAAVSSTTSLGGTDAAAFAIDSSTCGTTLAPGVSCSVQVHFIASSGTKSASLLIGSPSVNAVSLAANGVAAATVTTSPAAGSAPFSLGTVAVNAASSPVVVTINNVSGAALAVPLSLAGDAGNFVLVSTTCPTGGATLAAAGSCTTTLKLAPLSTGAKFATLSVGSPVAAFLSLTGTGM